jgi:hypothetical protein
MIFSWLHWLFPIALLAGGLPSSDHSVSESNLTRFLTELFAVRAQILIDHNPQSISHYYLKDNNSSQYAYLHETKRSEYLRSWANHRGVKFTNAQSKIRIVRQYIHENTAKISLAYSLNLTYQYQDLERQSQQFGLGTRHGLTLNKVNGQWYVNSEWFSDPLDVEPEQIALETGKMHVLKPDIVQTYSNKYNRIQALAYADKYAGGAWGAGNQHRYNNRYMDYTHLGGDCTNFASQVIGDSAEGGGLRMTTNWYYRYNHGGSEAWIRTDSFKSFILYRGYGRLITRGGFKELFTPSSRYPQGPFAEMRLGDLITYEIDGDVDHFGILTGQDPRGYPLVNSHTSDRYHVPMDLGWEATTKFSLIHIND